MLDKLVIPSYAKVNYTLDVLSKRPDGYHNLASVMQTISLSDTITFELESEPGIRISCDAPDIPTDRSNLIYRAAEAILKESAGSVGVCIDLQKRIPSQAGLGGGSSNAAYTLLALNRLLDARIDPARLNEIAADIGSDVPFFLNGGTASVRGRGESVTGLSDGPQFWFVVVKPSVNVSTAAAYQALDALPDRQSARATRDMEAILAEGEAERIAARMTNDFEQVVCRQHLPIALVMDELHMARARNARLCGSGAAVFGVAYAEKEAQEIARIMRLKYSEVHVCRATSREEAMSV